MKGWALRLAGGIPRGAATESEALTALGWGKTIVGRERVSASLFGSDTGSRCPDASRWCWNVADSAGGNGCRPHADISAEQAPTHAALERKSDQSAFAASVTGPEGGSEHSIFDNLTRLAQVRRFSPLVHGGQRRPNVRSGIHTTSLPSRQNRRQR